MIESISIPPKFAAFLLASLLLAVTPGPGVIYVITRSLAHGRKAGLASVAGIAIGNLGNSAAASVGLAAVLRASSTAFAVIKLAGAAYIIYLGLNALRSPSSVAAATINSGVSSVRLLRDGFLVALLNPKTALFFAALLPQFINSEAPMLAQSLFLGNVFVVMAMCTDSIYVVSASALGQRMGGDSKWPIVGKYFTAAAFFGLGIYAALVNPRNATSPGDASLRQWPW